MNIILKINVKFKNYKKIKVTFYWSQKLYIICDKHYIKIKIIIGGKNTYNEST